MMIKIALAQMNPTVGDLAGNSEKIIAALKKAKGKKANFIVFPELCLTGYPPEDLILKSSFIKNNIRFLNKIAAEASGIILLIGFIGKYRNKTRNSCAVIQDKKIIDIYHKIFLPNYGVFDEKRYFTPGSRIPVYEFAGKKFSLTICEDIWEKTHLGRLEDKNLDFMLNISASPYSLGKITQRKKILSSAAKTTKSFVFYCNLTGGQDEIVFDGRSLVYSPQGRLIKKAKGFCPDIIYFNLSRKKKKTVKLNPKPTADIYSALSLGLNDYMKKNGFQKAILGLSGGIDSAVTLTIAAKSIGKNKVEALIMPSPYSSQKSIEDAKKVSRNLGIKYRIISIDNIFSSFLKSLALYFRSKKPDSSKENLQARIRGNIAMAFSNKFGHLLITTGNKSEISCGYCTLYGDMAGGFGILKDVYKTTVYRLARFINRTNKKNIIPESVITKPPSAELRPNQKDSDSLPQYDLLDKILHLYIEGNAGVDKICARGFKKSLVKKIIKMVDKSEYKRRQAPMGIKISQRAFGRDRRMPVTNQFLHQNG